MYPVALRDEIRTWVLIQGKSQRAAARHFGLSRNTVAKLLQEEPAPKERRYQRQAPHTKRRYATSPCRTLTGGSKRMSGSTLGTKTMLDRPSDVGGVAQLGIPIGKSTVRMFVQERQRRKASLRSARLCAWGAGRV